MNEFLELKDSEIAKPQRQNEDAPSFNFKVYEIDIIRSMRKRLHLDDKNNYEKSPVKSLLDYEENERNMRHIVPSSMPQDKT